MAKRQGLQATGGQQARKALRPQAAIKKGAGRSAVQLSGCWLGQPLQHQVLMYSCCLQSSPASPTWSASSFISRHQQHHSLHRQQQGMTASPNLHHDNGMFTIASKMTASVYIRCCITTASMLYALELFEVGSPLNKIHGLGRHVLLGVKPLAGAKCQALQEAARPATPASLCHTPLCSSVTSPSQLPLLLTALLQSATLVAVP